MKYNRELVAERLEDLRKQNGKTISLANLSKEIEEKTGVYISATQLNKYENVEKSDIMNVENLMAIADYYDVSYDYLLGTSNARRRENVDINERTGLSDKVIRILTNWTESVDIKTDNGEIVGIFEKTKAPNELNKIIECKKFPELIDYIRSLSYLMDDEDNKSTKIIKNYTLGRAKTRVLVEELGKNATSEYILYLIQNTFRDIIKEISPYDPVDESKEIRWATQSDFDDMI